MTFLVPHDRSDAATTSRPFTEFSAWSPQETRRVLNDTETFFWLKYKRLITATCSETPATLATEAAAMDDD